MFGHDRNGAKIQTLEDLEKMEIEGRNKILGSLKKQQAYTKTLAGFLDNQKEGEGNNFGQAPSDTPGELWLRDEYYVKKKDRDIQDVNVNYYKHAKGQLEYVKGESFNVDVIRT